MSDESNNAAELAARVVERDAVAKARRERDLQVEVGQALQTEILRLRAESRRISAWQVVIPIVALVAAAVLALGGLSWDHFGMLLIVALFFAQAAAVRNVGSSLAALTAARVQADRDDLAEARDGLAEVGRARDRVARKLTDVESQLAEMTADNRRLRLELAIAEEDVQALTDAADAAKERSAGWPGVLGGEG